VIGLAATFFLSWAHAITRFQFDPARAIDLGIGAIATGPITVLLVLLGANMLFKRLGLRRWLFSQGEIINIYALTAVGITIATICGVRVLPHTLMAQFRQATPENQWGRMITDRVPSWILPDDIRQPVGDYGRHLVRAAGGFAIGGSVFLGGIAVAAESAVGGGTRGAMESLPAAVVPERQTGRKYFTDQDAPLYRRNFAGFYEGQSHPPWRLWLKPFLVWTAFGLVFYYTLLCLSALARRQWVEQEHLSFPTLFVPLELTKGGGNTPLFGHPFFRIGLVFAMVWAGLDQLSLIFPEVPSPNQAINLGSFLVNRPWNAIGSFFIVLPLGAFALFFIMPKDITFSYWVFYLVLIGLNVFGSAMGWGAGNPDSPVAMVRWPFNGEVGFGAFAGVLFVALWRGRKYVAQIVKKAFTNRGVDDSREPMSYRCAFMGCLAGTAVLVAFARQAGMNAVLALGFFLVVFVYMFSYARVRAESALPQMHGPNVWSALPDAIVRSTIGTVNIDATSLAVMGNLNWIAATASSMHAPNQIEAYKMGTETGSRLRGMTVLMMAAIFIAFVVGFFTTLGSYYKVGAEKAGWQYPYHMGTLQFFRVSEETKQGRSWDRAGIVAMASAVAFTALLALLRARFLWWPLHPVGFALAWSFWVFYYWFSGFTAWLAKTLILRYGGANTYKKVLYLCIGLLVGGWLMGIVWMAYCVVSQRGAQMADGVAGLLRGLAG